MKHRVLQFIPSYHQGGSERQAVSITSALKAEGSFDIFAATLNDEGVLKPEVETLGLPRIPVFPLNSFYDLNFLKQVRSCARFLKLNGIDLIHTHDFYTNVFGMAAAALAGTRVAIASKRETGGMRTASQDTVERIAFRKADAVVVNSESVKHYLSAASVRCDKIRIIYNGVQTSLFERTQDPIQVRKKLGLPTDFDDRLITIVANLRHDVKNIPMLLRAARDVLTASPNTSFVIAGEGKLQHELMRYAAELEIGDKIFFLGRCEDVPGLLSASYIGVLTSTAEGFSNAVIEYMAAGLPVVATRVGGAEEAVEDGETGFLVESNDAVALAEKLNQLLSDRSLAEAFGAKGRQHVKRRFSAAAQMDKTLELYREKLK